MDTALALLFFALFLYIVFRLATRALASRVQRVQEPHREVKLRHVGLAAFLTVCLGASLSDTASSTDESPAAASKPSPTVLMPTPTMPPTSSMTPGGRLLAAQDDRADEKAEARRELQRKAKSRHDRYLKNRKAANRAKARAKNEARRQRIAQAQAAAAEAEAAEAAASAPAAESSASYAGKTCAEIGHSFKVPPGSDHDHDSNDDGHACESF